MLLAVPMNSVQKAGNACWTMTMSSLRGVTIMPDDSLLVVLLHRHDDNGPLPTLLPYVKVF